MKRCVIWFGVLLLIIVIAIFLMSLDNKTTNPEKGVLVYETTISGGVTL